MGKLIKYEIKGNYKLFAGLFGITILLNLLLLTRANAWHEGAIIGIFSAISVALFVVTLIFVVQSFRNEMYEDRGYLTFTLPISGKKIVISKLVPAIIWFSIATIITYVFISIFVKVLFDQNMMDMINEVNNYINIKAAVLISVLFSLINLITLLLLIYFSITVTRVAFKKKRLSVLLGFITFIILNIVIYYIQYQIMKLFPQTVSISLDFLQNGSQINGSVMAINDKAMLSVTGTDLNINIATIIYFIAVYIGLFLGTGYLIDNNIDI